MRVKLKSLKQHLKKKGVTAQVINVFILVLIVSVLSGMTFLFTAQLKTEVQETATEGINSSAYLAVNKTEAAGYNTTKYLSLLFLALIFGAILIVVLRVMLPYINVGRSLGGGF